MTFDSEWAFDEDRCYHGVQGDTVINKDREARIFVELSEYGWTERNPPAVLRELTPIDRFVSFRWGYLGSGPNAAARAILHDALGVEPESWLRLAFTTDWMAQMPNEFRMRRPAILRWARGAAIQAGAAHLPPTVEQLPPVEQRGYGPRPARLSWENRRRGGAG